MVLEEVSTTTQKAACQSWTVVKLCDAAIYERFEVNICEMHHCFYFTLPFKTIGNAIGGYIPELKNSKNCNLFEEHLLNGGVKKIMVQFTDVYINLSTCTKWQPVKFRQRVTIMAEVVLETFSKCHYLRIK